MLFGPCDIIVVDSTFFNADYFKIDHCYRPQGKVMFSEESVCSRGPTGMHSCYLYVKNKPDLANATEFTRRAIYTALFTMSLNLQLQLFEYLLCRDWPQKV